MAFNVTNARGTPWAPPERKSPGAAAPAAPAAPAVTVLARGVIAAPTKAEGKQDMRVAVIDPKKDVLLHGKAYDWQVVVAPTKELAAIRNTSVGPEYRGNIDIKNHALITTMKIHELPEDAMIELFQDRFNVANWITPAQIRKIDFSKYPRLPENIFKIMIKEHVTAIQASTLLDSQLFGLLNNANEMTEEQWLSVDITKCPCVREEFILCLTNPHFKMNDQNFFRMFEIVAPTLTDDEISRIDLKAFATADDAPNHFKMMSLLDRFLGLLASDDKLKLLNPKTVAKNYTRIQKEFLKYLGLAQLREIDFKTMPAMLFSYFGDGISHTRNYSKVEFDTRMRKVVEFRQRDIVFTPEKCEKLVVFVDQTATGALPGEEAMHVIDPSSIGPLSGEAYRDAEYDALLEKYWEAYEVSPTTEPTNAKFAHYRETRIISGNAIDGRALIYDAKGELLKRQDVLRIAHPDKNIDRKPEAEAMFKLIQKAYAMHLDRVGSRD